MPPIHIIAAAAAVALAIPMLVMSVASRAPEGAGVFARRAQKGEHGKDVGAIVLSRGAGERVVRPALAAVLRRTRRFTPQAEVAKLERRLELAGLGSRFPVETLLFVKLVTGIAVAGGLWWATGDVRLAGAAGALGYVVPNFLIDHMGKERQARLLRELPDAIDQITMSVEAGLGFEAAAARTAGVSNTAIGQELRHTLQEMQLGASRSEALRNLAARNDLTDLRSFVSAVVQAEEYGLPIAKVLRIQSDELRTRRRQRAEERAMKIPVKMVFPLVLTIFPALLVVLLGPAAVRIRDALL